MSLRQWLTTGKLKTTAPTVPGLPDPGDCTEPREAAAFQAANDAVETIVTSTTDSLLSTPRKRKRGEYNNLDEEQRAKIGRLAVEDGVAMATRHFMSNSGNKVSEVRINSKKHPRPISKSKKSIWGFTSRCSYKSPRGNTLMLASLDSEVQNWIRQIRLNGGVINLKIVMAGTDAFVTKFDEKKIA